MGILTGKCKEEAAELQKIMDKEGKGEKLAAWDWWYYTEKLRKEKYNLSEEDTKPSSNWRMYAMVLSP